MKTIIIENTWLPGTSHGWGNGYALLTDTHPMYKMHYDTINESIDVHYGLTFSELVNQSLIDKWPELSQDDLGCWIVGFDTVHARDDIYSWPKEAVQAETDRLREQLEEILPFSLDDENIPLENKED